jgi:predicted transcriptional regulator
MAKRRKAMRVETLCQRLVFTIGRCDEINRAAQLMREKHIGYLVVVETDAEGGFPRPVGVLTDRDIVIGVLAPEVDPKAVTVGDIMTRKPIAVGEFDSVETALHTMRQFGVRRLPVVNDRGGLVGVLSADDVLKVIADDTEDLLAVIGTERRIEEVVRR